MTNEEGVFYVVEKCNDCVCNQVCKYKEVYQNGVQSILDVIITADREGGFWKLRDCPHIEVSIKCPHMVQKSLNERNLGRE